MEMWYIYNKSGLNKLTNGGQDSVALLKSMELPWFPPASFGNTLKLEFYCYSFSISKIEKNKNIMGLSFTPPIKRLTSLHPQISEHK